VPNPSQTEAELDLALAEGLRGDSSFAAWFFRQTRFHAEDAECIFVREDNPWGKVKLQRQNPYSGVLETLSRECETDILAVYESKGGHRLALHIENKLATGSFTPLQPELYRERLTQWCMKAKLGMYIDATSVLVAPRAFYLRNQTAAQVFEAYVSHEDIAAFLPAFREQIGR